jgi:hypothetical protein
MALVGLNEAAATGVLGNPLGAATPGGMSQILDILKIVRDIANSPLAATVAARFQGRDQGQVLQQSPIMNVPPQAEQPVQLPAPAAAPAPVLDEKKFLEMLMTPQGRIMMDRGLQQIKDLGGDMTISQMQDLLRNPNLLEPKKEAKPAADQKVPNGK